MVDRFPSVKRATFVDYIEVNQQVYPIRDVLPTSLVESIKFQSEWNMSLSRIGFDPYLTQALVYREVHRGCESNGVCCFSQETLFFLKKADNRWMIDEKLLDGFGECFGEF